MLGCPVLRCPVLRCPVLRCPVLRCPVLSGLVLGRVHLSVLRCPGLYLAARGLCRAGLFPRPLVVYVPYGEFSVLLQ